MKTANVLFAAAVVSLEYFDVVDIPVAENLVQDVRLMLHRKHKWEDATCLEPEICAGCGLEETARIIDVEAGGYFAVSLKSNGTVAAVGQNDKGKCNVYSWPWVKMSTDSAIPGSWNKSSDKMDY